MAPPQQSSSSSSASSLSPSLSGTFGKFARQVWLIIRNIWRAKRNTWKFTLLEVLLPIYPALFYLLLASFNAIPYEIREVQGVPAFPQQSIFAASSIGLFGWANPKTLGFSPSTGPGREAVEIMCNALNISINDVSLYSNMDELVNKSRADNVTAAVSFLFDNDDDQHRVVVHHPNFNSLAEGYRFFIDLPPKSPPITEEDAAIMGGYGLLQYLGVHATMMQIQNQTLSPSVIMNYFNVTLQRFPIDDSFELFNFLKFVFGLMFVGSFFISLQANLIQIGQEVERGIKRTLLSKGMSRISYWSAWFFGPVLFPLTGAILQVGILFLSKAVTYTNFGVLLLLVFLFAMAQTSFSLFVASLFGNKATGQKLFIFCMLFIIVSQGIYFVVLFAMINNPSVPSFAIEFMMLIYVVPFAHVMFSISDSELTKVGLRFDDKFVRSAYFMLAIDIVLYFVLALCFDYVYDFLRNRPSTSKNTRTNTANEEEEYNDLAIAEKKKSGGVFIHNLVKIFPVHGSNFFKKTTHLRAVDNLSFEVEKGNIFCLLGHNGAGKSTTFSMLDASIVPTSGSAYIAGYDVVRDRALLRSNMGVAPQFDICYESVSCIDQLVLFGVMGGLEEAQAYTQAMDILKDLMLTEKAKQIPSRLSGGQKRRLSLAIALMGKPKILLLDEITTGLDVRVRQCVWSLLQKTKKNGITVLMTTHSMEEAERLGDVIGIMSKGKLQALGPTLELKRRYGKGYHLHCLRAKSNPSTGSNTTNSKEEDFLTSLVTSNVRGAELSTNIGVEASYILPISETSSFSQLFNALDKRREDVISYGLSPATLEDVFLELEKQEKASHEVNVDNLDLTTAKDGKEEEHYQAVEGMKYESFQEFQCQPSSFRRIRAVWTQVLLQAVRNPTSIAFNVFWPIVMACVVGGIGLALKPKVPVPITVGLRASEEIPFTIDSALNVVDVVIAEQLLDGANTFSSKGGVLTSEVDLLKDSPLAAVSFNTVNLSANIVDLVLLYNESRPSSMRSTLATMQTNLAKLVIDTDITVQYFEFKSELGQNNFLGGGLTYFLAIAYGLLTAFYAEEMVRTRVMRTKDMMLLAGLPRQLFWFSYFLAHFFMLHISGICSYVALYLFGNLGVTQNNGLAYLLLLWFYGSANILFGYCLSLLIKTVLEAQQGLGEPLNLLLTLPWLIVTFGLGKQIIPLENFFSLVPAFGFFRGLAILESAAKNDVPFKLNDIFVWERFLAQDYLMLFISSCIWLTILILVEGGYLRRSYWDRVILPKFCGKPSKNNKILQLSFDELFENDDKRLPRPVQAIPGSSSDEKFPLLAKDVRKTFVVDNKPFHAVKNISLAVPRGEIFGLLGPNGAGKTTFISCINGVDGIEMDSGDAFIMDHSVVTELDDARKHMGICFQFDALNPFLTGREQLRLFANIRGVPRNLVEHLCENLISNLDLKLKCDARAGTYSGGNKRKLSVALSVLASPDVVFLDEPSTGLDPGTRRFLWNYLANAKKNKAIVLTTHSMEECDNLSSKIAIVVSGAVRTYGTSQELKEAHGTYLSVTARIVPGMESILTLEKALKSIAPSAKFDTHNEDLTSLEYDTLVKLIVSKKEANLSQIFETLNHVMASKQNLILDFAVSQTSLEDVFVRFAMMQEAESGANGNE